MRFIEYTLFRMYRKHLMIDGWISGCSGLLDDESLGGVRPPASPARIYVQQVEGAGAEGVLRCGLLECNSSISGLAWSEAPVNCSNWPE